MKTAKPIRVLIVDDEPLIRQTLITLLKEIDDLELVGTGANGQEAVELCAQHTPDIVLMDVFMPSMNGIEATQAIRQRSLSSKILALSNSEHSGVIQAMLTSGATGYVLKDSSIDTLAQVIRAAHAGSVILSKEISAKLFQAER